MKVIRYNRLPQSAGVYAIVNTISGGYISYVGSTTNLHERAASHVRKLNRSSHHNKYLQHAWNKYGEDAFVFDVLEDAEDKKKLFVREQHWLDLFKEFGLVYNLAVCTDNPNRGRHLSEEHRRRISRANTGGTHSPETRKKLSIANKGKVLLPHVKEMLARISRTRNRRPFTEKERSRMSESHKRYWEHLSAQEKEKVRNQLRSLPSSAAKGYPAFINVNTGEIIPVSYTHLTLPTSDLV